jgi:hypothetical protein
MCENEEETTSTSPKDFRPESLELKNQLGGEICGPIQNDGAKRENERQAPGTVDPRDAKETCEAGDVGRWTWNVFFRPQTSTDIVILT